MHLNGWRNEDNWQEIKSLGNFVLELPVGLCVSAEKCVMLAEQPKANPLDVNLISLQAEL
jgi:hypothetical protein